MNSTGFSPRLCNESPIVANMLLRNAEEHPRSFHLGHRRLVLLRLRRADVHL